jgi:hypothetical protein
MIGDGECSVTYCSQAFSFKGAGMNACTQPYLQKHVFPKFKTNGSFMLKKKNILTYTKSFKHVYMRSGGLAVQKQPKCGNYWP